MARYLPCSSSMNQLAGLAAKASRQMGNHRARNERDYSPSRQPRRPTRRYAGNPAYPQVGRAPLEEENGPGKTGQPELCEFRSSGDFASKLARLDTLVWLQWLLPGGPEISRRASWTVTDRNKLPEQIGDGISEARGLAPAPRPTTALRLRCDVAGPWQCFGASWNTN